ncbi:hypothetical protein CHUAL_013037 [Chamberlinius hualienensis]
MTSKRMGFASCLLTVFALKLWLVGCSLIGYMAWVLATSVTVSQFVSGQLIFTYIVVGTGFLLFVTGLFGWVGATSGSSCVIRMYCAAAIIALAVEIGGILTLNIMRLEMTDLIEHGWDEVNQATRNSIQQNLDCCGFTGPREFAYTDDPIDDSCYVNPIQPQHKQPIVKSILTRKIDVTPTDVVNNTSNLETYVHLLKQNGCGRKLKDWFDNNQVIWIFIMVGIGMLEILGMVTSIYIINSRRQRLGNAELLIDPENRSKHRFSG